MLISNSVKRVLTKNSVKIDLQKDYSDSELLSLYEKVITFLDRRLQQAKIPESGVEDICPVNLDEQESIILNDIETLEPTQLVESYSKSWFLSNHKDCNYLAAVLLCENAERKGYAVLQLWRDAIANGGVVKNVEDIT